MKKIVMLFAVVLMANLSFAQECKKICDKMDSYTLNGDLIEAVLYHQNGAVAQTGFYTKENKLHGEWVSYDSHGTKTAVASYDKGAKVGAWYFYQGDDVKEVEYSDSKIAKVVEMKVMETRVVSN